MTKCYMVTGFRSQLCRAAEFPHLLTTLTRKNTKANPFGVCQHLFLDDSSVMKGRFTWHLVPDR